MNRIEQNLAQLISKDYYSYLMHVKDVLFTVELYIIKILIIYEGLILKF